MAFLTFNGALVRVANESKFKRANEEIGYVGRSRSGTLRTSVIRHIRTWTFESPPLSPTTADEVETLLHRVTGTLSGEAFAGASITVRGFVTNVVEEKTAAGFRRVLSITLTEV